MAGSERRQLVGREHCLAGSGKSRGGQGGGVDRVICIMIGSLSSILLGRASCGVLLVRCFTTQGNGPSGKELIRKVPLYKQKWRVSEADSYT